MAQGLCVCRGDRLRSLDEGGVIMDHHPVAAPFFKDERGLPLSGVRLAVHNG